MSDEECIKSSFLLQIDYEKIQTEKKSETHATSEDSMFTSGSFGKRKKDFLYALLNLVSILQQLLRTFIILLKKINLIWKVIKCLIINTVFVKVGMIIRYALLLSPYKCSSPVRLGVLSVHKFYCPPLSSSLFSECFSKASKSIQLSMKIDVKPTFA